MIHQIDTIATYHQPQANCHKPTATYHQPPTIMTITESNYPHKKVLEQRKKKKSKEQKSIQNFLRKSPSNSHRIDFTLSFPSSVPSPFVSQSLLCQSLLCHISSTVPQTESTRLWEVQKRCKTILHHSYD